jgi:hypothetical protein
LAKAPRALLLFGDAASSPPWGTLAYTWVRRGHQLMVKTAANRKEYKVLGVIESCPGQLWDHGQAGRLNSDASIALRTRILEQTTQLILLMQDGLTSPTSAAMQRFVARHTMRLTVFPLSSDAPDDHPLEQLWKKATKAGPQRESFPTCEAHADKVEHALRKCANTPEELLALCRRPTPTGQGGLKAPDQKGRFLKAIQLIVSEWHEVSC